eukprot:m.77744 g.77744  ORF g.77744 m.77744 type:complete len:720 (+) comp14559_c0_seq1:332-2491(+)
MALADNSFLGPGDDDDGLAASHSDGGDRSRRSSFFFSEDDDSLHGFARTESGPQENDILNYDQDVTPFNKIVSVLQSLKEQLPPDSRESAATATSDDLDDLIATHPRDRLEWCTSKLEEYVEKRLTHLSSFDKIQRVLLRQLDRTRLKGDVELAKWVAQHYMDNTLKRRRTTHKPADTYDRHSTSSPPHSADTPPPGVRSYYRLVSTDHSLSRRLPSVLAVHEDAPGSPVSSDAVAATAAEQDPGQPAPTPRLSRPSKSQFTLTPFHSERRSSLEHDATDPIPWKSTRVVISADEEPAHVSDEHSECCVAPRALRRASASAPALAVPSSAENTQTEENTPRHITLPEFSAECDAFVSTLDDWGFDIFRLGDLSGGRPLTSLCLEMLSRQNLMHRLKLDKLVVARYLCVLEDNYCRHADVPYHTNDHAADVTHTTFALLMSSCMNDVFSDLEVFAAVIAAAAHDVAHFGLTNQFLVATDHPLAVLYNDQSVLENHHAATAFQLMAEPGLDLIAPLDPEDRSDVRKMIIAMIMSTDMAKHFQFLSDFRTMVEAKRQLVGNVAGPVDLVTASEEDKLLTLCAIVHCADLGASTKPWTLCREWCTRVMNEFFEQGDKERSLGLEVGPLHDREKTNIAKSQVGFIDFIVLPLWETWDELAGEATMQTKYLMENRGRWQQLADEQTSASAGEEAPIEGHDEDEGVPVAYVSDLDDSPAKQKSTTV